MISVELAIRLREHGLAWIPASGDRFVLPHRGMDDEVFVLADMTVDVHQFRSGPVIGFNGTTEWALDSVGQDEALWMPSEDQLRELIGTGFRRLERDPSGGYRVVVDTAAGEQGYPGDDPAEAYAVAVLDRLLDGR